MSKLYNVAGGALLHEELNDNYWKDKAKKLIKTTDFTIGLYVEKFEKIWDAELPRKRGMTKITAMDKMNSGDVKFLFVMGENTIVSDPNANHAIHAFTSCLRIERPSRLYG